MAEFKPFFQMIPVLSDPMATSVGFAEEETGEPTVIIDDEPNPNDPTTGG